MIALLLTVALAQPAGVLVDRVVAVVEKQVVTRSELLSEARVALALRAGGEAALAPLSAEFLTAFRDYLINELLVASQARRLGEVDVADDDIARLFRDVTGAFRSDDAYRAFLRRFDISEEVIQNILRRHLRNQRFIAQRMRLRLLNPTAAGDVEDAENYDEALANWLASLRQGAEIRLPGPDGALERQ